MRLAHPSICEVGYWFRENPEIPGWSAWCYTRAANHVGGDLVDYIAEALGVEPKIEYLPEQPGDVPITYADIRLAGRDLDYAPQTPIAPPRGQQVPHPALAVSRAASVAATTRATPAAIKASAHGGVRP